MHDKLTKWMTVLVLVSASLGVTAACGRGAGGTSTPTVSVTASPTATTTTPTATPTRSLAEEVSTAYLAYWDAYAQAVLNLDASLVARVAIGDELASIQKEIETHRSNGVAVRIAVEHDFAIVQISEEAATVVDRVVNRSFYVDAASRKPETSDLPGDVLQYTFFLEKTEGGWVVIRGLRESP